MDNSKKSHDHARNESDTSYSAIIESMAMTQEVPLFDAQVRTNGCKRLEDIYQ
jgi:hypothetical protein